MAANFASTVQAAAAAAVAAGESFCGGPKAYVAAVHARANTGMDLRAFKAALVAAHRAGEIELVRIDLGGSADGAMLRASEIVEGLATWHAVRAA